jgi:hypothetical protein
LEAEGWRRGWGWDSVYKKLVVGRGKKLGLLELGVKN